jgi:serine phosphatase RsbU (regulator of sigma subunit)
MNRIKILCLLALLLTNIQICFSQNAIELKLNTAENRIKFNADTSALICRQLLLDNNSKLTNEYLGRAYLVLAKTYLIKSNIDSADIFSKKALTYIERSGNKKFIAKTLSFIGSINDKKGKPEEALAMVFKTIQILNEIKDTTEIVTAYCNLARIYNNLQNDDKSFEYFNIAYDLAKKARLEKLQAACLSSIGYYYVLKDQYDKAKEFHLKALEIRLRINDKAGLPQSYSNLGYLAGQQGDLKSRIKYALLSISICKELGDDARMHYSYFDIGSAYYDLKKYDVAICYFDSSLSASKFNNDKRHELRTILELAKCKQKLGDYKSSADLFNNYTRLYDSLNTSESSEKILSIQNKFEVESRQKQIELLEKNSQINELKISNGKRGMVVLAIGIAFLLILAILFYNRFRLKQKSHNELQEKNTAIQKQKNELAEKNKEITDSIQYAKKIQTALLASDELFENNFDDYFILYKPKDIVAGDFYWAQLFDSKVLIVTADCTGHGVPGAFMSLLGVSFLNEITIEKGIIQPNKVFDALRNNIIKALNASNKNADTKDGMDAVLCSFDKITYEMEFVCANNPVWIIRDKELIEFKPDKMPIGKSYGDEKPFSLFKTQLKKGDVVYTLTDGFGDQFGGEKGKKFKDKQLKEALTNIKHLDLRKQKQFLDDLIENWKGSLEQVDDILLIAVKV